MTQSKLGLKLLSKLEKLIYKVVNLSQNVRFEQLKLILESSGYIMPNESESHFVFSKKNYPLVTVPNKHPIKIAYTKMVREIIQRAG